MEKDILNTLKNLVSFGILVVLVFAFKHSILDANNIPSGSMIPTLKIGDYLFVNKMRFSLYFPFTYWELLHFDDPHRGDIVTFVPPRDPSKNYVKRLIGMPGDRIRIRNISICDPKIPIKRAKEVLYQCDKVNEMKNNIPYIAFVDIKKKIRVNGNISRSRKLTIKQHIRFCTILTAFECYIQKKEGEKDICQFYLKKKLEILNIIL